jgi:DNA-directed RNA polymerase subunit L
LLALQSEKGVGLASNAKERGGRPMSKFEYSKPVKELEIFVQDIKKADKGLVGFDKPEDRLAKIKAALEACRGAFGVLYLQVGGLLREAKELCKSTGCKKFSAFLSEIGIKPDTASNLMKAWEECQANPELASCKASVVYATGKLPEPLKTALIELGVITSETTNKDIAKYREDYESNGSQMSDEMQERIKAATDRPQYKAILSQVEGAIKMLTSARTTLVRLFDAKVLGNNDVELPVKSRCDLAVEALKRAIEELEKPLKELREAASK